MKGGFWCTGPLFIFRLQQKRMRGPGFGGCPSGDDSSEARCFQVPWWWWWWSERHQSIWVAYAPPPLFRWCMCISIITSSIYALGPECGVEVVLGRWWCKATIIQVFYVSASSYCQTWPYQIILGPIGLCYIASRIRGKFEWTFVLFYFIYFCVPP